MSAASPGLRAIELVRVRLPLARPLRSAHAPGDGGSSDAAEHERDVVLVRALGTDGVEGWGECSTLARPTYNPEHTGGAWVLLRDELAPSALAGRAPGVQGNHMARAAVETALADLRARRADRPISGVLGGTRGQVPSCAVVGMWPSTEETCDQVAEAVERGYVQVKLKVRPGWSVEPLAAVRERWPGLALAADANGSFPPELGDATVRDELGSLDDLGLAYLEQPFPPDELVTTAGLVAASHTPVALDESVTSLGTLTSALALGAVRILNLKPARVGGLAAAVRIAHAAADAGIEVFVGGMLETGVGRAAALGLASLKECSLASDLGPSDRYFREDLTEPFELVDGCLAVPTGPGIGVVPDPDRLQALAVERLMIHPGP